MHIKKDWAKLKKLLVFILVVLITSPSYAGYIEDIDTFLNKIRIENTRQPLKKSDVLMRAAQEHAEDMLKQNYFSHTGKNGSDHSGRIRRAGYNGCYTAENIAKGQKTAKIVMQDWMASPGHRQNILSGRATDYGLGKAGNIWVMTFGGHC